MAHYDVQYEPQKTNGCAVIAVLCAIAFIVSNVLASRFEKAMMRDLNERYPTAEVVDMEKTGSFTAFCMPRSVRLYCRDTEYDMIFEQDYSRNGTHPAADDPDEKGYPARAKVHLDCVTQIAALNLPKDDANTVLRYPNDTGFTVFTKNASQDDIAALLEAMQPEKVTAPLNYSIGICSPELYRSFTHADFTSMYQTPSLALDLHGITSCMVFVNAFPGKHMSGDMPDKYDPEMLGLYTEALELDPAHSIVEISGVLGEDQPEIRIVLIQDDPN